MGFPSSEQCVPSVTVAIPTYKGAANLGAAVDSVLQQTFEDFELLVIDDNSPDDTRAVIEGFNDRRLVYVRNERNLGPQGNWNRCLQLARGAYFKLLPHDDIIDRSCLERQAAVLASDIGERIALVFCARNILGPDGTVLASRTYPDAPAGLITASQVKRLCIRYGTNLLGEPGAVMFRKSLADRVGPFDATNPYVIDLDYWFRLLSHGDAYCIPEPLAGFRISSASWSVAIGSEQSRDFRRFAKRTAVPTTRWDRLAGRFMPFFNNVGRLILYRMYTR